MRTYEVTLIGKTPLLMHHDNIEWADFMEAWKAIPEKERQEASKAGDDRTPAWRWLGNCYHNGQHLCIPQANVMRALMEGGTMVPVPKGKGSKTFKAQTQSGMMSVYPYWDLYINGDRINWADVEALKDVSNFSEHLKRARQLGFDLLVKRAKVATTKHVRVRPIFAAPGWRVLGKITVWDEQISGATLAQMFDLAGQYRGIGDWRPGSPRSPGPYGTFDAEIDQ